MRRSGSAWLWHWNTAALSACLALTACTGTTPDPSGTAELIDETATALARNESRAPLVHPLSLVEMKEPDVVILDVLPPWPTVAYTLFIGIRVNAADGMQSALLADKIIMAGLEAEVSLVRLDAAGSQSIPLVSVRETGEGVAELIPVAADGRVVGVRRDDVDEISMEQVGLGTTAGHSRYLSLALAQNPAPGTYRLSVRLTKAPAELANAESELLVAYRHRSK